MSEAIGVVISKELLNRVLSQHVDYWAQPQGFSDDCFFVPKSKWEEFVGKVYDGLRQGCASCGRQSQSH